MIESIVKIRLAVRLAHIKNEQKILKKKKL